SKTTARRLVAGATRTLGGPGVERGRAIARERHPAALLHALLVQVALLGRALVAIAVELGHRVVRARLVPLSIALAAAPDGYERRDDDEHEAIPSGHVGHGTMPPTDAGHHHRGQSPETGVAGPAQHAVGPLAARRPRARGGQARRGAPGPARAGAGGHRHRHR